MLLRKIRFIFLFPLILVTNLTTAQSFVNGDLEGVVALLEFTVVPDDWFVVPFTDPACSSPDWIGATPDLCNPIAPLPLSGMAGIAQSGEHFVAGLYSPPGFFHEGIMQEVSGFTIGEYYAVGFYQTPIITFMGADTMGSWAVYFDFVEIGISEPSSTNIGLIDLGMDWEYRVMIFQATATTHTIKFLPQSDGLDACEGTLDFSLCYVRMALDNVALTFIDPGPDFLFENVCLGDEMFFENTTASTDFIDSWLWDFGDGTTSDLENPTHLYDSPGTYNVKLNASYFDSITYVVTVFPPPIADFEYIQEIGFFTKEGIDYCANNMVQFTDLSVTDDPDFVAEWYWDFGDGSNATVQHPEHIYNEEGAFFVNLEVTTDAGCIADTTKNLTVESHIVPTANFDFILEDNYYSELPIQFHDQSLNTESWQWNFGDGAETSEQHPSHYYSAAGNHTITLIATNTFCHDTIRKIISTEEELLLYVPNTFTPNGDGFNTAFKPVFTSGFDPYDYHLTIFNRWGEIIFESYNAAEGWDGTYGGEIVNDGVYLWIIEFGSINSDEKLVRQGHVTSLK
ncbi:MAG: gliding motility-associated-like protein [Crocinitomix sp.]|jgi:gliding motility-associated-like protein